MKNRITLALIVAAPYLLLTACGSDVSGNPAANAVANSEGCITASCHGSMPSVVTGRSIADEWRGSSHFARGLAGCATCHKHSHQSSCSSCHGGGVPVGTISAANDPSAECNACHVTGSNLMKSLDTRHIPELSPRFRLSSGFNYYSAAGYLTMRGTPYESKCIWCHNPHDNRVLPQHKDWAESGHGDTNAGPFATRSRDFKTLGSSADWSQAVGDNCVRCHTATGYINLVNSNMKDVSAWGLQADGKTPISFNRQTLYCNVCHDNGNGKAYGFNLRQIPTLGAIGGVRVYQNFSAASGTLAVPIDGQEVVPVVTASDANKGEAFARLKIRENYIDLPNGGISNRCMLCHSGRASGQLIKRAAETTDAGGRLTNFRKMNRVGVHDFAGAGTMFRSLGFEFYPPEKYAQPSGIPYVHDQIGSGFAGTGSRGPCVSCHMSSRSSHSFLPVDKDGTAVTSINTALCSSCHAAGGIGNSRFNGTVTDLNQHKSGYAAALKALAAWLNMKGLNSSNWLRQSSYPLPTSVATPLAAQTLLQSVGSVLTANGLDQSACVPAADRSLDSFLGMRNMGASMNQNYLINDPAGYVHNDLYVKRLIYDSLDWLDNCGMNNSVEKAINLTQNDRADNEVLFRLQTWDNTKTPPTSRFTDNRLTPAEVKAAKIYLMGVESGGGRPGGN
jgi:hypothetical protein